MTSDSEPHCPWRSMTNDERLIHLEALFMHLQRTVQDLDQVVIEQSKQIDLLSRDMKLLVTDLRGIRDGSREPRRPEDEIPPHY